MTRTLAPLLVSIVAVSVGACGSGTGATGDDAGGMAPLTVRAKSGDVMGVAVGSTRAFLGIPFAAPPVGALRFRPPAAPTPWSGTLDASKRGAMCAQINPTSQAWDPKSSEDCLTLNVWTPDRSSGGRPVMVWLHGGAFVVGSG